VRRTPNYTSETIDTVWLAIREWLAERDIILSGRYSEWEYYNSDHAFLAGKKAAEKVKARSIDTAPAVKADG